MATVNQDFSKKLDPRWHRTLKGGGELVPAGDRLCFVIRDTRSHTYTDAQIDDYQGLARRHFPWRPPLTLKVRARFSHPCGELSGTAGFGFWNDPFMMTGRHWPTLPRAIWFFFSSPPSNMKLDLDAPGHGWKAATIDALQWSFLLLSPTIPLVVPLMNSRRLYRALWPIGQRAIRVSETSVKADMVDWHMYVIEWGVERARFFVDQTLILDCDTPPRGPLGFVMWLDNQYAVVTPWGRLRFGFLDAAGVQRMDVATLMIEPGQG